MSYEGLEIGDGGEAIEAYHKMCAVADGPKTLDSIRKDLLEYCCQDTLAMVKLLEVIREKTVKLTRTDLDLAIRGPCVRGEAPRRRSSAH